MALLILGLALWVLAHMLKRLAPSARDALTGAVGAGGSKLILAGVSVVGLLLIVVGYRQAPVVAVYAPPAWGIHLNNLAMLAAVALLGMGMSRGRARSWLRHPMLTGVLVWALAHLLVNGDLASIVLFGVMAAWSVASMALINLREPVWERPEPGPVSGDVRLAVITVVVYVAIALVHGWLGYWPFPR